MWCYSVNQKPDVQNILVVGSAELHLTWNSYLATSQTLISKTILLSALYVESLSKSADFESILVKVICSLKDFTVSTNMMDGN